MDSQKPAAQDELEIETFSCSVCKKQWYGLPRFEGNDNVSKTESKICNKCYKLVYYFLREGPNALREEIARIKNESVNEWLKHGKRNEGFAVMDAIEKIESSLFNEKDGVLNPENNREDLNSLELKGKKILDDMHICYSPKVTVATQDHDGTDSRRNEVDALIMKKNDADIVIQWDGDYFHWHPDNENPTAIQLQNIRKDKLQNRNLMAAKMTVVRVFESDMRNDVGTVKKKIWDAFLYGKSSIPGYTDMDYFLTAPMGFLNNMLADLVREDMQSQQGVKKYVAREPPL